MGNDTLSNRFLEINGVATNQPRPTPSPVSNRFLEINDALPRPPLRPSIPAPWTPPLTGVLGDMAATITPPDPRNNPSDARQLAERHAPILVLPEGQYNLPADPIDFIDASRLRQDNPLTLKFWQKGDDTLANNTDNDGSNDFGPARIANPTEDNLYLDLDNDARGTLGRAPDDPRGPAPLHYELDLESDTPKITYYVFYPYNDGPSVQNHEGDWERVTLELDPETLEPTHAILSAHTHSSRVPIGDIADPETGRPVIYVAGGSHANYATQGSHDTEVKIFKDNTVTHDADVPLTEIEDAVIYDSWGPLRDVTTQDWYTSQDGNNGVRWGEIGESTHTSGPHGPSGEKGAVPPPGDG